MTDATVTAIIATHNSRRYIDKCIAHLRRQSHQIGEIIVVDSGSTDTEYLEVYQSARDIKLIYESNIGYSAANNRGYQERSHHADYIIFLNPDTFLLEDCVSQGIAKLASRADVGVISGRLTGFDSVNMKSTGKLDSTGVFRKIYGRWYDRGRELPDTGQFMCEQEVPALCGALLFCRHEALENLGGMIFDQDFFLYKEDIEFSLRLRKNGWKLLYSPDLQAYHCRGWQKRNKVSNQLKEIAAESEILLYRKHPSPYIFWAYLKYWLVVIFRI